ncbi:UNVERIFIED_CONTAM: hypothetical protein Sangu_1015100 [Sesamum angustifolium]|uniref:Uncharacterized protein n=1 Tax=Sesamum angustifolium TaxID=2727405 RepID=A0AAW2PH89_9LAMI
MPGTVLTRQSPYSRSLECTWSAASGLLALGIAYVNGRVSGDWLYMVRVGSLLVGSDNYPFASPLSLRQQGAPHPWPASVPCRIHVARHSTWSERPRSPRPPRLHGACALGRGTSRHTPCRRDPACAPCAARPIIRQFCVVPPILSPILVEATTVEHQARFTDAENSIHR